MFGIWNPWETFGVGIIPAENKTWSRSGHGDIYSANTSTPMKGNKGFFTDLTFAFDCNSM